MFLDSADWLAVPQVWGISPLHCSALGPSPGTTPAFFVGAGDSQLLRHQVIMPVQQTLQPLGRFSNPQHVCSLKATVRKRVLKRTSTGVTRFALGQEMAMSHTNWSTVITRATVRSIPTPNTNTQKGREGSPTDARTHTVRLQLSPLCPSDTSPKVAEFLRTICSQTAPYCPLDSSQNSGLRRWLYD